MSLPELRCSNFHSSSPHMSTGDGAASNSKTQINEGFYGKPKRHAESNVHLHFPNKENTDLKHSPKEALNDQGEKRPEQLACIVQRTNENKHYSKTFFLCDL